MASEFEKKKNRKAFIYTLGICGGVLVLSLLISWKISPPVVLPEMDLIEVNLDN